MAECHFHEESYAQIVLDLMEEVEKNENHPLKDMIFHFENFESAYFHLFKECPIGGFCAGEMIPIHKVYMDNFTQLVSFNLKDCLLYNYSAF